MKDWERNDRVLVSWEGWSDTGTVLSGPIDGPDGPDQPGQRWYEVKCDNLGPDKANPALYCEAWFSPPGE
jgi:hypothetical protein